MFPSLLSAIVIIQILRVTSSDVTTLEVVHIIFRHGEKNADLDFSYPTDPHKNATRDSMNPGQLNKAGKRTMYDLGSVLKGRYSKFLAANYAEDEVDAWASPLLRTIFSMQILMASLFRPNQEEMWDEDLNWQPTLYHFNPRKEDRLYLMLFSKEYMSVYNRVCTTAENQRKLKKYQGEISYIRKHSSLAFECTRDAYILYLLLESEVEANLTLPKWTRKIYPQPLKQLLLMDYQMQFSTIELQRILIGDLMMKILSDTLRKLLRKSRKKFHLYAGHDVTLIQALSLLGFDTVGGHIPGYGACLALEVHKIEGEHVLKVFYRQNKYSALQKLHNHQGRYSIRLVEFEKIVRHLFDGNSSSICSCSTLIWVILALFMSGIL